MAESLDEKVEMAYQKAQEYLGKGSYARALKVLRQIERLRPGYKDLATLIPQAEEGRRVQNFVQWVAILIGSLAFLIGWFLGVRNDLALLAIGAAGILIGVVVGNVLYAWRAARRSRL